MFVPNIGKFIAPFISF